MYIHIYMYIHILTYDPFILIFFFSCRSPCMQHGLCGMMSLTPYVYVHMYMYKYIYVHICICV